MKVLSKLNGLLHTIISCAGKYKFYFEKGLIFPFAAAGQRGLERAAGRRTLKKCDFFVIFFIFGLYFIETGLY
jgi:hypothetical protein